MDILFYMCLAIHMSLLYLVYALSSYLRLNISVKLFSLTLRIFTYLLKIRFIFHLEFRQYKFRSLHWFFICKKGTTCKKKLGDLDFALVSREGDFSRIRVSISSTIWFGDDVNVVWIKILFHLHKFRLLIFVLLFFI